MPDREKVIKELHDARRYLEDKEWSDRGASPHIDALNDALTLLKEQPQEGCKWCSRKPVFSGSYCLNCDNEEALADGDWTILYMGCDEVGRIRLTACGDGRADYYPKFCPECGKPVNQN